MEMEKHASEKPKEGSTENVNKTWDTILPKIDMKLVYP